MKNLQSFKNKIQAPTLPFEPEPTPDPMAAEMNAAIEDMRSEVVITDEPIIYHVPKRPWKDIFKERETGIRASIVWDPEIKFLEEEFAAMTLPQTLGNIIDVPKFISSHLATAKNYNGIPRFEVYLERLADLYYALKN